MTPDAIAEQLAKIDAVPLGKYVHPCPRCEGEFAHHPGLVLGWYSTEGLKRHLELWHGEPAK